MTKEDFVKEIKELTKDNGGKAILTFLFSCMFMPKDEFEKFMKGINDFIKEIKEND